MTDQSPLSEPHRATRDLSTSISEKQGSAVLAAAERKLATKQLYFYRPYAKQRDFHEAGATFRERLFLAGNQLGAPPRLIPSRFPPLRLVRRLPTEPVAHACIRQASDNPSQERTSSATPIYVRFWGQSGHCP
jgi:hypothetical protein